MTTFKVTLIALMGSLWIGISQASQPFQNIQFPSWLSVQLVGQHLEINGISQTVYTYKTTASHDVTHNYFKHLLQQWTLQESEQTEAPEVVFTETVNMHTLSQFKAPYFVTVQHDTAETAHFGRISVANLAAINTHWQKPNVGFTLPNTLVLRQRVTDLSPVTDTTHDTLIYDSNASLSTLNQEFDATLRNAHWQNNSLTIQPDSSCRTQFWVHKEQNLMISLCHKLPSGTSVILVRESS